MFELGTIGKDIFYQYENISVEQILRENEENIKRLKEALIEEKDRNNKKTLRALIKEREELNPSEDLPILITELEKETNGEEIELLKALIEDRRRYIELHPASKTISGTKEVN